MALVAFPSPPALGALEDELHQFERIATGLSSRFTALVFEDLDGTVAASLEEIRCALGADHCAMVELGEAPDTVVRSWGEHHSLRELPGLLPGLGAGRRISSQTTLAVPVSIAGRVSYAVAIEMRARRSDWPTALIERLRLVGEILGTALHRRRQEQALREITAQLEQPRTPGLEAANQYLQEEIKSYHDVDEIVGHSAALRLPLTRLMQVASMNSTVLLLGETGTGKELFARALHDRSRRRARALVRVNCAALPAEPDRKRAVRPRARRFHRRGRDAPGTLRARRRRHAVSRRDRRPAARAPGQAAARAAGGGVRARRFVTHQEGGRPGHHRDPSGSRTAKSPRAVSARTCTTASACSRSICPPLRERPEDIPALVWFFIHRLQRELERRITKVPQSVMAALQQHDWPGNVRELENVVERAMIRTTGEDAAARRRRSAPRRDRWLPPAGDTLDEVQRLHIERVLRECGVAHQRRRQRGRTAGPPSQHASVPHARSWASSARADGTAGRVRPGPSDYRTPAAGR